MIMKYYNCITILNVNKIFQRDLYITVYLETIIKYLLMRISVHKCLIMIRNMNN